MGRSLDHLGPNYALLRLCDEYSTKHEGEIGKGVYLAKMDEIGHKSASW